MKTWFAFIYDVVSVREKEIRFDFHYRRIRN